MMFNIIGVSFNKNSKYLIFRLSQIAKLHSLFLAFVPRTK